MINRSHLDYAAQYEACEQEDLRKTGEVQAGFEVATLSDAGDFSFTGGAGVTLEDVKALIDAPSVEALSKLHDVVMDEQQIAWLRHRWADTWIFERPIGPQKPLKPILPDWDALNTKSRGNLWKLCYNLCNEAAEVLETDRAMIYRFHEDWCGEVIAEKVSPGLEPFLGLHYPPTDIPTQARALYLETRSRHIFTTTKSNTALMRQGGSQDTPDLSHALARSVSPYHVEYLVNMGSASTASCALVVDGKLWGLLSLHFTEERPPSLTEFGYLQSVSHGFEKVLSETLKQEAERAERRQNRMVQRYHDRLEDTSDPFGALMLSSSAIHRLLSAQGCTLIVDQDVCNIGAVPNHNVVEALCQQIGPKLDVHETFAFDRFPGDIVKDGQRHLAGALIVRLGKAPDAFLILFRIGLEQTVNWGGDPRRQNSADEKLRVTPRKSFEKWVERVEGCAAHWTQSQIATLTRIIEATQNYLEVSSRELVVLLRNGLRQTVRRRDYIRPAALDVIEGIKTAIAIGIEKTGEETSEIIAVNTAGTEAFNISAAEAAGMSVQEMERIIGADLIEHGDSKRVVSVATATNGIRECEIVIGLLFEYIPLSTPEDGIRIQVYEFRDVTEAVRIQKALEAARDRAISDLTLRSEFFAKLSHELRTPLNALVGFSTILTMADDLPEDERVEYLNSIHSSAMHMTEIVDGSLKNMAAVQAVNGNNLDTMDVSTLVPEVLEYLRQTAKLNTIDLEWETDQRQWIVGDVRALRQVLMNIISNAIKYNVPGGKVSIRYEEGPDFISILVQDTGIGMSEEQLARCMKAYQRFTDRDGAGLGLSIAHHLMKSMGGVLSFTSQLGQGTTCKIQLARAQAIPEKTEPALRLVQGSDG